MRVVNCGLVVIKYIFTGHSHTVNAQKTQIEKLNRKSTCIHKSQMLKCTYIYKHST